MTFVSCLLSLLPPQNVESTGKRLVVGVDVSSRLGSVALGSLVSTVTVAAAMSMVRVLTP